MDDDAILEQMAAGLAARGYKIKAPDGRTVRPPPPAPLDWPFVSQHVPLSFREYRNEPNPDRLVYARIEACTKLQRRALDHEISVGRLALILTADRAREVMDILVVRLPVDHPMKTLPPFLLAVHTDVLQIAPPAPPKSAKPAVGNLKPVRRNFPGIEEHEW